MEVKFKNSTLSGNQQEFEAEFNALATKRVSARWRPPNAPKDVTNKFDWRLVRYEWKDVTVADLDTLEAMIRDEGTKDEETRLAALKKVLTDDDEKEICELETSEIAEKLDVDCGCDDEEEEESK